MPLTPTQAAAVAEKFGLGVSDAAALASLAGSVDEAEQIAARFSPNPTARQLSRADLAQMTPEAIEAARRAGQLDQLMRGDAS